MSTTEKLPFTVETKKTLEEQRAARWSKLKLNGWTAPEWKFHTGHHAEHFKDFTADCAVRALSLATGYGDYLKTVELLGVELTKKGYLPSGTPWTLSEDAFAKLGWSYTKEKGRLTQEYVSTLPNRCVLNLGAAHVVYVEDGVLFDTYQCALALDGRNKAKNGKYNPRVTLGYWSPSK